MVNCIICAKSVAAKQSKIECKDCKKIFHANCVNMTKDEVEFIASGNQIWRCTECSNSRRKSMAMQSTAEEGNATIADIIYMLEEAKEERKKMEADLGKSLDLCHEKIDDNKKAMEAQAKKIDEYLELIDKLTQENKMLKDKVNRLEERIEESEQYSRINNVEIHGIPEEANENVMEVVKNVGVALDMKIEEHMIDVCHRLRKRPDGKPAGIVVRFVQRHVKHALLQKRKVKRTLNTGNLGFAAGSSPVYINESLTFLRRKIFAAARELKTEKGYRFLWIKDGKILMRKEERSPVIVLTKLEDINKL